MKFKTIIFVCRGNIVRSPVAEFVLNREFRKRGLDGEYVAISRGVQGTSVDLKPVRYPNILYYSELRSDARIVLNSLEIDISNHTSKVVDEWVVKEAELVFAMDGYTLKMLKALYPFYVEKFHLFSEIIGSNDDVVDVSKNVGIKEQQKVINYISETIVQGFPKLLNFLGTSIVYDK